MDDLGLLIERVRQHSCRITWQRLAVLRALCELDGHASAEVIHRQIGERQQDVDLSTFYRTLERFRDLRILSQTDLGKGCAEYEIVADRPHHHLICRCCGHTVNLNHDYLTTMAEAIGQDFGFRPILDHLAIFGLCQECQNSAQVQYAQAPLGPGSVHK
jgi:Fur family ferric uptake transcriptional regulator